MLWAIWTRGYGLQEFAIWILATWLLHIGQMVTWLWLVGYGIGYMVISYMVICYGYWLCILLIGYWLYGYRLYF
jgi:hypothetical protein